jgi:hypothetical protein
MYVCMFQHKSGTPGAISTKLGTHMTIYIFKNIINYIYIYIIKLLRLYTIDRINSFSCLIDD